MLADAGKSRYRPEMRDFFYKNRKIGNWLSGTPGPVCCVCNIFIDCQLSHTFLLIRYSFHNADIAKQQTKFETAVINF